MMISLPSLEYNLSHPHPKGRLFLLATLVIFLLTLPVLVLVNLVTQGSELVPSLQSRFQPNDTLLEGWWGTRRLPALLRPDPPPCEPKDLGRGDTFRLSASLFDYTVMSTWNTSEGGRHSTVQEQKRLEYRGQSFADCYVNNTQFDYSMVEQTQTVTVGVTCPGSNPQYPIYVSMETKITLAWSLSKDFIGQYYGPGLDLMSINNTNPSDYRKLVLATLEVISTDSLTIMRGSHLSDPALSASVFATVNPNTGGLILESSTFAYVNGTLTDQWPSEAEIYSDSIINLLYVVNDAVNLDLGSNMYANIFRNASALDVAIVPNLAPRGIKPSSWAKNSRSFYYGRLIAPYQTWAQMLLDGLPVKLGNSTGLPSESVMITTYLCPTYQVKPLSSLLSSIFVGTATMTLSVWGIWMFVTAIIAKKISQPQIHCACDVCTKKDTESIDSPDLPSNSSEMRQSSSTPVKDRTIF